MKYLRHTTLAVILISLMVGCETSMKRNKEKIYAYESDVDKWEEENPIKPPIRLSEDSDFISPLPKEYLIGEWEGAWYEWHCSSAVYRDETNVVHSYYSSPISYRPTRHYAKLKINADGSFDCESYQVGSSKDSSRGKWSVKIAPNNTWADLFFEPDDGKYWKEYEALEVNKRSWRQICWLNEDEFCMGHFQNNSEVEYTARPIKYEKERIKEYNGYFIGLKKYGKDNCLNESYSYYLHPYDRNYNYQLHKDEYSVAWFSIEKTRYLLTPIRFTRVGEKLAETRPLYNVVSCERAPGSDFAYRFELDVIDDDKTMRTVRRIQNDFRAAVKSMYMETSSYKRSNMLQVNFPEYRYRDGKITGMAEVLAINVTALEYDPTSRQGKMSAKIGADQLVEARAYIRKNIETLARDKNIALVTGEIPPPAKFYLGREELKDGNVLEIEFKTE